MAPTRLRILRLLYCVLLFAAAAGFSGGAQAQAVSYSRELLRILTASFVIYFPLELEPEARRLASFADMEKKSLESLYGDYPGYPIPILLTDEYPDLNGYSTPVPSDRIVIYVSPSGLTGELSGLNDTLKSVFVHELTHALDFRTRSPFWRWLTGLAGDPVNPAVWILPTSFIEGSAVYSESRTGQGRNNDPSAGEMIVQARTEHAFPPFFSVSGARDSWNSGSAPYIFGGAFVDFLGSRYGKDKFGELRKEAGKGNVLSGFGGTILGAGAFRKVFGVGLDEAWSDFESGIVLSSPEPASEIRVLEKPVRIASLTAWESSILMADAETGAILEIHEEVSPEQAADKESAASAFPGPEPGKREGSSSGFPSGFPSGRRIFPADASVDRIDVSPDGKELIVSWRMQNDGGQFVPTIFRIASADGKETGPRVIGLRAAAWMQNGIVAIMNSGFRSGLVRLDNLVGSVVQDGSEAGSSIMQLPLPEYDSGIIDFDMPVTGLPDRADGGHADGGQGPTVRGPTVLGSTIYALARTGGRTFIGKIDTTNGQTFLLDAGTGQIRSLSRCPDGRLLFSFTEPGNLSRLAILDDSKAEPELAIQTRDLSGGVHLPVMTSSGKIYCAGRFVSGEYLCRIPEETIASMVSRRAAWIRVFSESSSEKHAPADTATESSSTDNADSNANSIAESAVTTDIALPLAAGRNPGSQSTRRSPAFPLLFRTMRLPSANGTAIGMSFQGEDIAERMDWTLEALYDWKFRSPAAQFTATAHARPFACRIVFSDSIVAGGSLTDSGVRIGKAGVVALYGKNLVPARKRIDVSLLGSLVALADGVLPGSAYTTPWDFGSATIGLKAGISEWLVSRYPPLGRKGYSIVAGSDLEIVLESDMGAAPSVFAQAQAAIPFTGLEFSVYGALAPGGRVIFGPASRRLSLGSSSRASAIAIPYPPFVEYEAVPAVSNWYVGAEMSARLFSMEIQSGIPVPGFGTPFYIRRIVGRAGVRMAGFNVGNAASDPAVPVAFPTSLFLGVEAQLVLTHAASLSGSLKPGLELSWAANRNLSPQAFRLGFHIAVTQ